MSEGHKKSWHHKSKAHTAVFSLILATIIIASGIVFLFFSANLGSISFKDFKLITKSDPIIHNVDLPLRLQIPSIEVDANIQSVGRVAEGRMGIPNNFTDVARYNLGPKPGEKGSAVIDGHLDTVKDANAVFIRLSELKKGDQVFVIDKKNQKIKFRVLGSEIYDESKAPVEKIFGPVGSSSRLNLITCDGVWNQKVHNYSQRLVVYTERIN
jgi:LPXTG-site transpeptidase (sortase) family protein